MMATEQVAPKSQRHLVVETVVEALRAAEARPLILTFDSAIARQLGAEGHEVIVADPAGSWPRRLHFELVICAGLLEKADDDRAALRALHPLLEAEALVLVVVPASASGHEPPRGTLRHYAAEELLGVILRAGFTPERWLAEGPELHVVECRRVDRPGAAMVADVSKALAEERFGDAEAALSAATEQMDDADLVREYALLVGHVHLSRGRLAGALEAFAEASRLGKPTARALTAMGAVAVAAGDMAAALELFEAARGHCPTHFGALRGSGMAHRALGALDVALTELDMAAVQRPADRQVAELVVEVAVEAGRADVAAHAIARHAAATSDDGWAEGLLASLSPKLPEGGGQS